MKKPIFLIGILCLVLVGGCVKEGVIRSNDGFIQPINDEEIIYQIEKGNVGVANVMIREKMENEQIFMDSLPKRKNCIQDINCTGRENTFEDNDCRFYHYFWSDEIEGVCDINRQCSGEDYKAGGDDCICFCNKESGELLFSIRKDRPNFLCNDEGECKILDVPEDLRLYD